MSQQAPSFFSYGNTCTGNPPNPKPNHPTRLATLTGAKWKYWSEPFGFSNLYATKNIFGNYLVENTNYRNCDVLED